MTSLVIEKGVDVSIYVYDKELTVVSNAPFDLEINERNITVVSDTRSNVTPLDKKRLDITTVGSINVRHGAKVAIDWNMTNSDPQQVLRFNIEGEVSVNGHRCEIVDFSFCSSDLSKTTISGFVILRSADIKSKGFTTINCYKRGNVRTSQSAEGCSMISIRNTY